MYSSECFENFQFEGYKIPLSKSFLLSMPDLLNNPHIQLDHIAQIIFFKLCFQAIAVDTNFQGDRGTLLRYLCRRCLVLADSWEDHIRNTDADLFLATSIVSDLIYKQIERLPLTIEQMSLALEACDCEMAWKMLGHAFAIAKALGYFSVDEDEANIDENDPRYKPRSDENEVEKNRKRFRFWHLLRTDCLFRLTFGKPTLIVAGSWKVNLPDPTITGIDDESSHFVQIHFLASMRLVIVVMKYLDWVESEPHIDVALHDATIDSFVEEIHLSMSEWNTVRKTSNSNVTYELLTLQRMSFFRRPKLKLIPGFAWI